MTEMSKKSDDEMIVDAIENQIRTIIVMISNCSFPDIRDNLEKRRLSYYHLLQRRLALTKKRRIRDKK